MIQISKRGAVSRKRSIAVRLAAIVLAIVVCALITMATTGTDPFAVFSAFINGSFGSERKLWIFLQDTAILLIISLAVTPAFKMHCWNLGAEGQVLAGAMAAVVCMVLMGDTTSNGALIACMVIASVVTGALWAGIPAFFKAKFNTNETLFTLMMNYVATQLVAYFCVKWENPKGSGIIGIINQSTEAGWLPQLGNKYLLVIIVAIVMTVLVYFYLNYTKHGYEIAVVGESERTARYIGIKVPRVIIRTMLFSGAICGVAGLLLVGSIHHTVSTSLVGGQGFTAVMVSWLAAFNPIVMILTSALLIFMGSGANQLASSCGLNQSFGDILTGVLIFFIIGSEFFVQYKISFRKKNKEAGENV
ncbi:MAG TPA: ABC transporter permease [Clostridiales bacterium]|nr:ABC transporter permease [Clostridiales bacterium]